MVTTQMEKQGIQIPSIAMVFTLHFCPEEINMTIFNTISFDRILLYIVMTDSNLDILV